MKILIYADQHWREFGSYLGFNKLLENGLTGELNNQISASSFVAQKIEELNPGEVWNLGDVFHDLERISIKTLHAVHLGLNMISKACKKLGIPHYLIPGNHDCFSEVSGIYSVSILSGYFNEIFLSNKVLNSDVGIVPHHTKAEDVYNGLMEVSGMLSRDGVIFTHNEFSGARYENNFDTDSNLSPELPLKIISGHIHLPQQVGNVWYVGSLVQNRFAQNKLNPNGILIYDTECKAVTRLRNNRSKHYVVVKDLDTVRNFDPRQVILKVFSDRPQEEMELILKDYEYAYFPVLEKKDDVQNTVIDFQIEDPLSALKAHISQENPEALEIFEKVVKKRRTK